MTVKASEQLNLTGVPSAGTPATDAARPVTAVSTQVKETALEELKPGSLDWLKYQVARIQDAGLAPSDLDKSAILLLLQQGMSIGLNPLEAMKHGYVVNGIASFDTQVMAAQLHAAGGHYDYTEDTPDAATIVMVDPGGREHTLRITFQECEESGYTSNARGAKWNWKGAASRRYMLRYRAMSMAVKAYCPDVLFMPLTGQNRQQASLAQLAETSPQMAIKSLLAKFGLERMISMAVSLNNASKDEPEIEAAFLDEEDGD